MRKLRLFSVSVSVSVSLIALLSLPALGLAQDDVDPSDVIKINTHLITVPVSVMDRDGRLEGGLNREDFQIFEDGKPQELVFLDRKTVPFDVLLLMDSSTSMEKHLAVIREAAKRFIKLALPQDTISIVTFWGQKKELITYTNDQGRLLQAVEEIDHIGPWTRLYGTLESEVNAMNARGKSTFDPKRKRAVVLMSDGQDCLFHSQVGLISPVFDCDQNKEGRKRAYEALRESDAMTFPIDVNLDDSATATYGKLITFGTRKSPSDVMRDIGKIGGGLYFKVPTMRELPGVFERVVESLRSLYVVGYYPKAEPRPGEQRRIKIKLATGHQKNLVLRYRDVYTAAGGPAPSAPPQAEAPKLRTQP
jgi:Ca-activated chloride channel homolog